MVETKEQEDYGSSTSFHEPFPGLHTMSLPSYTEAMMVPYQKWESFWNCGHSQNGTRFQEWHEAVSV